MAVLKNPRHEKYAQGLFKGLPSDAAYKKAGFKYNRGNAGRLNANEYIVKRVEELQQKVAAKAEWSAVDRLQTLAKITGNNAAKDPRVAVSAIAEANKMQGSHEPTKIAGEIFITIDRDDSGL